MRQWADFLTDQEELTPFVGLQPIVIIRTKKVPMRWDGVVIGWGSFECPPCLIWRLELAI